MAELFSAIVRGSGDAGAVRDSISAGVDLEARDADGRTPLLLASFEGKGELCKVLIEGKADIEARDREWGATPFLLACVRGHAHVLRHLREAGADVNAANDKGDTGVQLATLFGQTPVVDLLLESRADIESIRRKSGSLLMIASFAGHLDIVRLLVDKGADIESKLVRGSTPLIAACISGRDLVVEYLLGQGAAVEAKDKVSGNTALHAAVFGGNLAAAKLLVDRGAPLDARNHEGSTPIHIAKTYHHDELVDLLNTAARSLYDVKLSASRVYTAARITVLAIGGKVDVITAVALVFEYFQRGTPEYDFFAKLVLASVVLTWVLAMATTVLVDLPLAYPGWPRVQELIYTSVLQRPAINAWKYDFELHDRGHLIKSIVLHGSIHLCVEAIPQLVLQSYIILSQLFSPASSESTIRLALSPLIIVSWFCSLVSVALHVNTNARYHDRDPRRRKYLPEHHGIYPDIVKDMTVTSWLRFLAFNALVLIFTACTTTLFSATFWVLVQRGVSWLLLVPVVSFVGYKAARRELLTWHPIPVHGIHVVFSLFHRVVEKLLADSTGALWTRESSQMGGAAWIVNLASWHVAFAWLLHWGGVPDIVVHRAELWFITSNVAAVVQAVCLVSFAGIVWFTPTGLRRTFWSTGSFHDTCQGLLTASRLPGGFGDERTSYLLEHIAPYYYSSPSQEAYVHSFIVKKWFLFSKAPPAMLQHVPARLLPPQAIMRLSGTHAMVTKSKRGTYLGSLIQKHRKVSAAGSIAPRTAASLRAKSTLGSLISTVVGVGVQTRIIFTRSASSVQRPNRMQGTDRTSSPTLGGSEPREPLPDPLDLDKITVRLKVVAPTPGQTLVGGDTFSDDEGGRGLLLRVGAPDGAEGPGLCFQVSVTVSGDFITVASAEDPALTMGIGRWAGLGTPVVMHTHVPPCIFTWTGDGTLAIKRDLTMVLGLDLASRALILVGCEDLQRRLVFAEEFVDEALV